MVTIETVKKNNRSKCASCNWFSSSVKYLKRGELRYIVLTPYMFNAMPQARREVLCESHGKETLKEKFKELKGLVYGFQ